MEHILLAVRGPSRPIFTTPAQPVAGYRKLLQGKILGSGTQSSLHRVPVNLRSFTRSQSKAGKPDIASDSDKPPSQQSLGEKRVYSVSAVVPRVA